MQSDAGVLTLNRLIRKEESERADWRWILIGWAIATGRKPSSC